MAQLTITKKALPLSLAVAGSHAALELFQQCLPLIYPLLIAERGFTYSQIGTVALVVSLCGMLTQPLFGLLSDRFNAKRMAIASIAWMAMAMALVGVMESYTLLLVCVGAAALASAAYHPSGASLVSHFGRKGTAMSLFATGGGVGAAFSPLLIAFLLSQFGLGGTLGLLPIGLLLTLLVWLSLRQLPNRVRETAVVAATQKGSILALTFIVILTGARSWVEGVLISYLPEWQVAQGASLTNAGLMLSLFIVAVTVGNFCSGFLSERLGEWRVIFVSLLLLAPLFWLFINGGMILGTAALLLFGMLSGFSNPIAILMAQEAWPRGVGLASALAIGIGSLPSGIGAWTIGRLADQTSLADAFSTVTWVPLISVVAIVAYRLVRSTEK